MESPLTTGERQTTTKRFDNDLNRLRSGNVDGNAIFHPMAKNTCDTRRRHFPLPIPPFTHSASERDFSRWGSDLPGNRCKDTHG
ncbi:hypothetical protein ZHAS_00001894 [Anopheles sinensis]|uniref:Uncharacterized protein n=1 Tax=Anopheles sinensis TaxID=74873 RepID=A0A084VBN3_ANOSI|nr:hypothetical protein ZHAS_00001894 [Anopheles sinensis]